MARKSIFEIVEESNTQINDIERMKQLCEKEKILTNTFYSFTLFEEVSICFSKWKSRGHCLDLDDYLSCVMYKRLVEMAKTNEIAYLTFVELVSNFYMLAKKECQNRKNGLIPKDNFFLLNTIIEDCLSKINHTRYYDEQNERVYVVEDKSEVSAVVEIVEKDLAIEIIRYNHHSLKGDLKEKRAILIKMYNALEPKKERLENIDKKFIKDINMLVNRLNIRHNNIDEEGTHYKEIVARMSSKELEVWYDETYQMILLANLLLDNKDREKKIAELRKQFGQEKSGE